MTYYRMACRDPQTTLWTWKTTILASLQATFQLLKSYSALPQDRILVFTATSKEELNQMLLWENSNLPSGSVTAAQFLRERKLQVPEQSTAAYGAREPEVGQVTAIATDAFRREQWTTPGFAGSGNTNSLERKRQEIEGGPGGDHDTPYRFTFPISTPQMLAWIRLQTRVEAGELQP